MDPGWVGGQFAAGAGVEQAEFLQQLPAAFNIISGRVTEPQEVAVLIACLLSDVAGNIVGADYVIDGGQIKTVCSP
ncbi:hypothetical protein ACFRFU_45195 [Streptomyces sp. NPDC056704]|uniref:hypothetical protein n=1 Tax=Streptomyces TaxID=1883 RepID=UPI0036C3D6A9